MPTYDYACDACGETTEVFLPTGSAKAPGKCPSCGSDDFRRKLSAPAGQVKSAASAPTCCPTDQPCATPACAGGQCPF